MFWVLTPDRLSKPAHREISQGLSRHELACADVSLWEIALLIKRKRIRVDMSIDVFLSELKSALHLQVLPITPVIAALSQTTVFVHKDPADHLIAATALAYDAPLVSADTKLAKVDGLRVVW